MLEANKKWYQQDAENACDKLYKYTRDLIENLSPIRTKYQRNVKLYLTDDFGNLNPVNNFFGLSMGGPMSNITGMGSFRVPVTSVNVVKSCIDSLLSKITKNKIKPMFLTDGGTYKAQKKAQMLNQFLNGIFYETKFYDHARMICRDAMIFGQGYLYVYEDENHKVCVERVFPNEILVDMNDGLYGQPQNMYRYRLLPREYLLELYPDHADDIRRAKAESINTGNGFQECLMVVEAWHLKVGDKPGRHMTCIETCTLSDEEYLKEYFPILTFRYCEAPIGFYALGIPDEITGIQLEINRLMWVIQTSMRRMANPKILVEDGSSINTLHMTDEIGIIVKYRGNPPTYVTNQSVNPDVFNQVESLINKAYQIVGISQLSAQSAKPGGLNSGKALDTYHDIETERFASFARAFEQFHVVAANQIMKLVADIVDRDGDYEVTSFSKTQGMQTINFKEIKVPSDGYVIQCWPVSDFPNTPEGKLKFAQDMTQAGFIDPQMAMELLDFPDDQAAMQIQLAPYRLITSNIEYMLETGKYVSPEPFDNLELSLKLASGYYNWARLKKVEEEKLDLIRNYIESIKTLMTPPQPEMPMPPPDMPPPDGGMPMDIPPEMMAPPAPEGVIQPQVPPLVA